MKKGFTIIEILIAMIILFVAIGFVNISIKAFNSYQRKAEVYQNFYITALSLKDWVEVQDLDRGIYEGKLNGLEYKISIKLVIQKKNLAFDMQRGMGNYGNVLVKLYYLNLILKDEKREKKFEFYLTKQKNLVPQTLEGISQ
ncbi:MAG: prepilin-type N-terminal cleavage/methylation domain-containing protein [Epsilonproteobacteria bacterium]|nr:prepilin-type N-terminal cleavage/methylation domain-containing protein [Campylobacterota bacterium]